MDFTRSEIKSGILVIVTFTLLTLLTFKVSDFRALAKTEEYKIHFNFISGLEKNAPVHYAGHSVGTVKSIEIKEGDPAVEVVISINNKIPIRVDSEIYVDTLGLLGEKFISISPGKQDSAKLPSGGTLRGNEPTPIHQMITQINALTENLVPLTEKGNRLLEGHEKELGEIITNLNESSKNLKDMTSDLKFHPWKLLRKK